MRMGKTLTEKIFSEHTGKEVKAGEIVLASVDIAMAQDGTGPLMIKEFQELGFKEVKVPKAFLFIDHASPSPRRELSNSQKLMREFGKQMGVVVFDMGDGISHQVLAERFVRPGDLVVGADSHTCTAGGLGAFGTGMGSTDVAIVFGLGKNWFKVPEAIRVVLEGELPEGVYAKDVILEIARILGSDGATYKALEFQGSCVEGMDVDDRLTISNMAVEVGAKAGLMPSDEKTREYLKKMGREEDYRELKPDPDAIYEQEIVIDVSKLEPLVAFPHYVDNVKRVSEVEKEKIKIDQVFIGTCTNGRLKDLEIALKILRKHGKHPDVRLIVGPASRRVYAEALEKGLIKEFVELGAAIIPPGCGPCVGIHLGVMADGERVLSTQNRNFKGRMGNPEGEIYLGSPAVAAAAAVTGYITDPRRLL